MTEIFPGQKLLDLLPPEIKAELQAKMESKIAEVVNKQLRIMMEDCVQMGGRPEQVRDIFISSSHAAFRAVTA